MSRISRVLAAVGLVTAVVGGAVAVTGTAQAATSNVAAASCVMPTSGGLTLQNTAGAVNGAVDVVDSLAQVLPAKHLIGAGGATVCAARDSYASFQIEVSASQGVALSGVSLAASALTGPGGAVLPGTAAAAGSDVQFDREDYVTLSRLSDAELDPAASSPDTATPAASRVPRNEATGVCTDTADTCRFPDQLIPARDSLFGETRNAFPMTVPAGENRTVWVDLQVPTGTAAGIYTGTVTITQSTGQPATVPVQLQVVAATLPATSTSHSALFYEHPNTDPQGYQEAAELGLADRISVVPDGIVGGTNGPASVLAPLMSGTDPKVKLRDASGRYASLTDLPMGANADLFSVYRPLFTSAVSTTPWAYCDEWGSVLCAAQYANHPAKQWPGIGLLAIDAAVPMSDQDPADPWADPQTQVVPNQLASITRGVVDLQQLIDPVQGWLGAVPKYNANTADRSSYLRNWAAASPGRQAWSYLTNMSGSSDYSATQARYVGFASYGIDQVASEQVATGWQNFNEGLTGQLYWEVNRSQTDAMNTAKYGLTGDGLLFYPYVASQVGGQDPVPVESIRVKRIRNGQQDYELLHLADTQRLALADGRTARSIAATTFPALSSSAVAPNTFDTAEQDLYRLFPLPTAPSAPPAARNAHDLNCDGTPDFLAVQAGTGKLLFYPRTATDWTPDAPITVGTGFGTGTTALTYTALLLPGDLNGDGQPDLLGRRADGSMWLMAGNCTGTFAAATKLSITTTDPISVGDFNGDGRADLFDKHTDGTLWLFTGTGNGTFNPATQAGSGWQNLQVTGIGDFNHDGDQDVVARQTDGSLLLYEGNGSGSWKTINGGLPMGLTLPAANYPNLLGVGDLNSDNNPDLVAVDSAGTMWRYNGNGANTLSTTPTRIGGGWNNTNLTQIAQ